MQRLEICSLLAPGKGVASWDCSKSPKGCLSPKTLDVVASAPRTRTLDLVISLPTSSGYGDVPVPVVAAREAVTVGDVLNSLHTALQQPVDMKKWNTKAADFKDIFKVAAARGGVPRVLDLFVNKTKFSGLAFDEETKILHARFSA